MNLLMNEKINVIFLANVARQNSLSDVTRYYVPTFEALEPL